MSDTQVQDSSIRAAWLAHAHTHPYVALGLAGASLAVLWLLVASLYGAYYGEGSAYLRFAILGGAAGFAATALGALTSVTLKGLSARTEDSMLGFAAGMMLAASSFSLILPGVEAAKSMTGSGLLGALTVVMGLGLGVLLMLGLDQFTPHEHERTGPCGPGNERISRVWLFVLAITLHNLPEGMAIGVSFAKGDLGIGLPLTSAIAIQDIPEGLAVAMALRSIGLAPLRAALIAAASGLMEPLGAILGIGVSSGFPIAYPIGLGLAAGAMIFVVSHEVIPETHRNGHQTPATLGLMGGFAVMMVLDTALG